MKKLGSRRAKACAIPTAVKMKVWERDEHRSIFSGSPNAFPECHYVSRANNGLGVEENIFTATREEHRKFDSGTAEEREEMKKYAEQYLRSKYPDWDPEKLVYKKYEGLGY
ncbi:hypothetical protein LI177_02775 [bacterium 210820-DFI.6.37]|nr:hypothetical protein [bacterium 210820-DFI.6.37]